MTQFMVSPRWGFNVNREYDYYKYSTPPGFSRSLMFENYR